MIPIRTTESRPTDDRAGSSDALAKWIAMNKKLCSRSETVFRILSYLVARKQFTGSRQFSELLYSASNLIHSLMSQISNPHQLYKSISNNRMFSSVKMTLAALECFEVFLEISVESVSNELKWALISVVEVVKLSLSLFLLFEPKITHRLPDKIPRSQGIDIGSKREDGDGTIMTMPRSKIKIRTIAGAVKQRSRSWSLSSTGRDSSVTQMTPSDANDVQLNPFQYCAESIYLARPIVYLLTRYTCGPESYKPWLAALVTEFSSLILHDFGLHVRREKEGGLGASEEEMRELKRRTLLMLLYVLRSPFYDNVCQMHLSTVFLIVSSCLPGSHLIIKPLMDYLPQWQQLHFNVWCK